MFGRIAVVALVLLLVAAGVLSRRLPGSGLLGGAFVDVVAPLQELVADVSQGTSGSASVPTIDELVRENQRLRTEVDRLTRDAVRGPELQRENEELRELLNLRRGGVTWQWLEARVIGFDATNLVRSATINRGARDGLVDGMTVVTPRGLVGKVVTPGQGAVRVLLLTDPSSTVNAMVQRTRARGVLYGQRGPAGSSSMVMRFIQQGEEIKTGDRVITSGLGGIFPEGIAVGQVAQVRQRDTDMFQEAVVEPYVDFARLENVYVITNHVPVRLD